MAWPVRTALPLKASAVLIKGSETIIPLDYKQTGEIVDDELHDIMVRPLPAGCRLTAIFDSCHSGERMSCIVEEVRS